MTSASPRTASLGHDRGRLDALTGVRAVAALWVAVYHFQDKILVLVPALAVGSPLFDSGYLGVDLFFTLSGFILAYNYLHRLGERPSLRAYGRFLWLRLARVWPVHFFTLNVMVALVVGARVAGVTLNTAESIRYTSGAYAENLTLTQVWWRPGLSFNGPAWSVSAEWFAYLLFPVAAVGLLRLPGRRWVCWVGVGLCYGLLELELGLLLRTDVSATTGALLRIGFEFLAGCLLYRVWESSRSRRSGLLGAVAAAALIAGAWTLDGPGYRGLLLAPLFGLLILAIAGAADSPPIRLLALPLVVMCGEASYSLYMTHEIVNMVVSKTLPATRFQSDGIVVRAAVVLSYAALVAAAATTTYLWVERPARERMRKV